VLFLFVEKIVLISARSVAFHCEICDGCTLNCDPNSFRVLRSFAASKATLALNSAECRLRLVLIVNSFTLFCLWGVTILLIFALFLSSFRQPLQSLPDIAFVRTCRSLKISSFFSFLRYLFMNLFCYQGVNNDWVSELTFERTHTLNKYLL
jgi:hypothetical protein